MAQRTAGGHRRIDPQQLLRIAQTGQIQVFDLSQAVVATATRQSCSDQATLLRNALVAGDRTSATRLIEQKLLEQGMIPLAEDLITHAMHDIGLDWQRGKIDVMHEHRATELCLSVLFQLAPRLEQRVVNPIAVAVGCSPTNDFHRLASMMVKMVMTEAGWKAINLGGGISATNLEQIAIESHASLVWISATKVPSIAAFAREFTPVIKRLTDQGIRVCVGGQAVTRAVAKRLGASDHGARIGDLVKIAAEIQKRASHKKRPS